MSITTTTTKTTESVSVEITGHRGYTPRRRLNIPLTDLTTHSWWNAQVDVSTSIRLLVLEEVAAHGIVDRVNRIGAQLVTAAAPPAAPQPAGTQPVATTAAHLASPFVSPVKPAAPVDPRDAEILELKGRIASLQNAMSPFLTFEVGSAVEDDSDHDSRADQDNKPIVTVLGTGSAA